MWERMGNTRQDNRRRGQGSDLSPPLGNIHIKPHTSLDLRERIRNDGDPRSNVEEQ